MKQIRIPTLAEAKSASANVKRRVREWQVERAMETLIRERGYPGAIRDISNHRMVREDLADVAVDEIFSSPSPPMFDQAGNLTRYGYEQLTDFQDSAIGERVAEEADRHRVAALANSPSQEWLDETMAARGKN